MVEINAGLAGKIALVTGAAHGIGAATARHLHERGARLVLMDLPGRTVRKLQAEWDDDRVIAVGGDVSVPEVFAAAIEAGVEAFGGLDVLVNNAATGSSSRVDELEPADWKHVVDVSLGGVLNGMKYAVPAMRQRGGGSIVNLSSVAAHHAMYAMAAYAAAKAGVEAVTRCAAIELRPDHIRVNAVAPGMIRSRAAENSVEFLEQAMASSFDDFITHRQGRWGTPEEVASVIAHFAGDESSFATGQTYVIDHGASLLL